MQNINVMDYKNLAYKFAKKYRYNDLEDGVQDAFVSLLETKDKYDHTRNIKFITYAYKYVMGYVRYNKNAFNYKQLSINYLDGYNIDNEVCFMQLNKILNEREIEILVDLYVYKYTMREVGRKFNISPQRILQICQNAIKQCKIHLQQ